ncbi:unnamed protein product [Colias eurytheme]|nr:unnamed protein product [Colias eurytheme]
MRCAVCVSGWRAGSGGKSQIEERTHVAHAPPALLARAARTARPPCIPAPSPSNRKRRAASSERRAAHVRGAALMRCTHRAHSAKTVQL